MQLKDTHAGKIHTHAKYNKTRTGPRTSATHQVRSGGLLRLLPFRAKLHLLLFPSDECTKERWRIRTTEAYSASGKMKFIVSRWTGRINHVSKHPKRNTA